MDSLPPPPNGMTWGLAFADEFNGERINPQAWFVHPDKTRGDGWFLRDNVVLDGKGSLVFRTTRKDGRLAGAGVDGRGRARWKFGYFEIRAKLPGIPAGNRPAFWLTGPEVNRVGDEGRDGTEIDIFEAPGRTGRIEINLHWDGYGPEEKTANFKPQKRIDYFNFHTYAVWWSPTFYRFYIDGDMVWETTAGGVCQVPLSIVISDEPMDRANWRGASPLLAGLDAFVVDYVRVYQLAPAPVPAPAAGPRP